MSDYRKNLGIYIHIPFCVSKCLYCDFLSFPADENAKRTYVEGLLLEIKNTKISKEDYIVKTIFIGGGTPSSIAAEHIEKILETVRETFDVSIDAEITIECNPGTVDRHKLMVYKDAGINRISFGLQSGSNKELLSLGRIHTLEEFLYSYKLATEAGFNNINIDIMSGLCGQSLESYVDTVRKVAGLNPQHISAYSLIVEEGTPLFEKVENAKAKGVNLLPDEDTERNMYYETKKILEESGYRRYEISNYAKPGYECEHNLSYWNRVDYIGFGLGSASLINEERFSNVRDMEKYLRLAVSKGICYEEKETLDTDTQMAEFMFLGLRKTKGVSKAEFKAKFGISIREKYGDINEKYIDLGLLCEKGDYIYLTDAGIDVSNVVMSEYV